MIHNDRPDPDDLVHYGVPGMKWGRRKARKELLTYNKAIDTHLDSAATATTKKDKRAAADGYKKDVYDKIRTPEFKEAYMKVNSMSKSAMVIHALAFGPLAAVSIPATAYVMKKDAVAGYEEAVTQTANTLRELRS